MLILTKFGRIPNRGSEASMSKNVPLQTHEIHTEPV